jgi:hypothetical protein
LFDSDSLLTLFSTLTRSFLPKFSPNSVDLGFPSPSRFLCWRRRRRRTRRRSDDIQDKTKGQNFLKRNALTTTFGKPTNKLLPRKRKRATWPTPWCPNGCCGTAVWTRLFLYRESRARGFLNSKYSIF